MVPILKLIPIVFLLLIIRGNECSHYKPANYSGYSLYRCVPQTEEQLDHLRSLFLNEISKGIQFWSEPNNLNGSVDIMSSPESKDDLRHQLKKWKIPTSKIMHDVGKTIEETNRHHSSVNRQSFIGKDFVSSDFFHSRYNSYSEIELKLNEYAKNPLVSLEIAGYSSEGRQIHLVKISSNPDLRKPVIFIDALHHAREWISMATAMYLMDVLLKDKDKAHSTSEPRQFNYESRLKSLLKRYDFWFVPAVNPDGYEYTRYGDRLWRKTRSKNTYCVGVDPNRNYPFQWNMAGASDNSCSDIYAGPSPLSEPETKAIANILDSYKKRIIMYLSLHSYSQLILCPYGHKRVYPDNYRELKQVAEAGMSALGSIRGTSYRFGPSAVTLYPAAGGSDDYAHGIAKIRYSYTMELPDQGRYGFLIPPSQIIPIGQETVAGLSAMVEAL